MRRPPGAKWRGYFELKGGTVRYLLTCRTQKLAWKSIAELFADPDAPEWITLSGSQCVIREYGIEPTWDE